MSKPSIAELLRASGYTVVNTDLVIRAVTTLYGNIGAGLDELDWDAILASDDPLAAAETEVTPSRTARARVQMTGGHHERYSPHL